MRSALLAAVAIAVALAVVFVAMRKDTPLLTPADIEQVTGLAGARVVSIANTTAGSQADLEVKDPRGQTVLRLTLISADAFRKAKEQKEIEGPGGKIPAVLFNQPVPGVGDEAFDGPPGPRPNFIYFRKGNRAALMTAVQAARLRLGPDDLHALAKIAAGRL